MKKVMSIVVLALVMTMVGGCSTSGKKNRDEGSAREAFGKAEAAYKDQRLGEAKELYLETLEKAPNQYDAMYRLGNIAFRDKDFREARDRYQSVLALNRNHAKAHYNLAIVHLILAEQHFRFFLTTKKEGQGNTSAVIKVMGDIDNFSRGGTRHPSASGSKEDDAIEAIANEFAF